MAFNPSQVPALTYQDIFGVDSIDAVRDKVNTATDDYLRKCKNFNRSYKGKLHELSPKRLVNAIERYHALDELRYAINSRVSFAHALNRNDTDLREIHDKAFVKIAKALEYSNFFNGEFGALRENHPDAYRAFRKSNVLSQKHQRFLCDWQYSPSAATLTEAGEKVLETASDVLAGLTSTYDNMMAAAEFSVNGVKMNYATLKHIAFYSPDSDKRKAALAERERFFSQPVISTVVNELFNAMLKINFAEKNMRDDETYASRHHEENGMDEAAINKMFAALKKSGVGYRYFSLKARQLGKQKLAYDEVWAPLPGQRNKLISWDEARDIVVSAFASFSPRMGEAAQKIFDNGWIDAKPRMGKDSGGATYYHGTNPWILTHYQGTLDDVLLLAHEMGHAVGHMMSYQEQGSMQSEHSTLISEVAASMGEEIVFDELKRRLIEKGAPPRELAALQAQRIENELDLLIRGHSYKMSIDCHKAKHGMDASLSNQTISDYWIESRRSFFGVQNQDGDYIAEAVSPKTIPPMGWATQSLFFNDPFYEASYPLSKLITLRAMYEDDGSKTKNLSRRFENFISKGNIKGTAALVRNLGVDMDDADFWKKGLAKIERMIDEYEQLLAESHKANFSGREAASEKRLRYGGR